MNDPTPTDRPGRDVPGPDRPGVASAVPSAVPSRRPRDMVLSLLVLLVPVVLLVGGYQVVSGRTQPAEVDPAPALAEARAAGFEAAEPTGLASDWVLVSAAFRPGAEGGTLRLGYATPDGGSAQLVQSSVPPEDLLPDVLPDAGPPAGTVEVAGSSWQRYATRPGEQALVLLAPELTTIAIGATGEAELRALAAAA